VRARLMLVETVPADRWRGLGWWATPVSV